MQNAICKAVSELDGKEFTEDAWTRPGGGGGISRVLKDGNVWEKAGCSLSVVYGTMPQEALQSATTRGADRAKGYAPGERVPFFACGLSSVMHPRNPMVRAPRHPRRAPWSRAPLRRSHKTPPLAFPRQAPTMHFNYRYFETDGGVWWFGGGSDLTPSYLFEEDVKHFHQTYKARAPRLLGQSMCGGFGGSAPSRALPPFLTAAAAPRCRTCATGTTRSTTASSRSGPTSISRSRTAERRAAWAASSSTT